MKERLPEPRTFSPSDMADVLLRQHGVGAVAHPNTVVVQTETEPVEGPYEGKRVEIDGNVFEFAKVPTHTKVFNRETGQLEPGYHSLRTWHSHHTPDIGPGPAWDMRLDLLRMTEGQQLERYGHVFTREEVFAPGGKREFDGSLSGGMPDDIPYYELVPVDEQSQHD